MHSCSDLPTQHPAMRGFSHRVPWTAFEHAATSIRNSIVWLQRANQAPGTRLAFSLPLLTHTSWQTELGRWFKFGLRNHKCALNRCPISRNHPFCIFRDCYCTKGAQTRLSAVIRWRRHSSHLARIRKAGVAASNRIAQLTTFSGGKSRLAILRHVNGIQFFDKPLLRHSQT
jgi:hypothetical protein